MALNRCLELLEYSLVKCGENQNVKAICPNIINKELKKAIVMQYAEGKCEARI